MIGVVYVKHKFQSTLPVRGATSSIQNAESELDISIHAPREGSDDCLTNCWREALNFNPRSP